MHSSRMRTGRSLTVWRGGGGSPCQGGSPCWGGSPCRGSPCQGGSPSRGVSLRGAPCQGVLLPGGLPAGGSFPVGGLPARGVLLAGGWGCLLTQGGSPCSGVSLPRGFSFLGVSLPGFSLLGGLPARGCVSWPRGGSLCLGVLPTGDPPCEQNDKQV